MQNLLIKENLDKKDIPKKFEEIREGIKRNLRRNHPDWSDERIESSSWKITTKFWQDKYRTNP